MNVDIFYYTVLQKSFQFILSLIVHKNACLLIPLPKLAANDRSRNSGGGASSLCFNKPSDDADAANV